jgi:hypothetical protein
MPKRSRRVLGPVFSELKQQAGLIAKTPGLAQVQPDNHFKPIQRGNEVLQ